MFGGEFLAYSYLAQPIFIFGEPYGLNRVVAFLCAAVLCAGLYIWLHHTRAGLALRAVSVNPSAAGLVGINVARTSALAFALGGAVTAAGGALLSMFLTFDASLGVVFTLKALVIVIIGGVGDIRGTIVASFILGLAETAVATFVDPGLTLAAAYILFIVILLGAAGGPVREAFVVSGAGEQRTVPPMQSLRGGAGAVAPRAAQCDRCRLASWRGGLLPCLRQGLLAVDRHLDRDVHGAGDVVDRCSPARPTTSRCPRRRSSASACTSSAAACRICRFRCWCCWRRSPARCSPRSSGWRRCASPASISSSSRSALPNWCGRSWPGRSTCWAPAAASTC